MIGGQSAILRDLFFAIHYNIEFAHDWGEFLFYLRVRLFVLMNLLFLPTSSYWFGCLVNGLVVSVVRAHLGVLSLLCYHHYTEIRPCQLH
jgi:hypothetical protein